MKKYLLIVALALFSFNANAAMPIVLECFPDDHQGKIKTVIINDGEITLNGWKYSKGPIESETSWKYDENHVFYFFHVGHDLQETLNKYTLELWTSYGGNHKCYKLDKQI